MVSSVASTVEQYLEGLPPDRRKVIRALRQLIRRHLPPGYEEGMQYGMIGYRVPLARFAETYNGQPLTMVALASQARYMSLYLMAVYGDPVQRCRLEEAFRAAGKKLDMGKSCVRFSSLDALPLDALGELIGRTSVEDFIASYENSRASARRKGSTARAVPAARPAKAGVRRAVSAGSNAAVTARPAARLAARGAAGRKKAAAKPASVRAASRAAGAKRGTPAVKKPGARSGRSGSRSKGAAG